MSQPMTTAMPPVTPHAPDALQEKAFRQRMQRIDALVAQIERFPDPASRDATRQIIQAILELHGAAIERMLDRVAGTGGAGLAVIDSMTEDELVSNLLLLHGLHPLDLETRVLQALDQVRPYLRSHGGNVEFLGLRGGVVRLQMQGSCNGCPSSALTLKTAIEGAIREKAPDAAGIEVEGAAATAPAPNDAAASGFVPADQLLLRRPVKTVV